MDMSVCCKYHMSLLVQDTVVGKDWEFQNHLVYVCVAIPADAQDVFLHVI